MEVKKSPKADLEGKKILFFEIGLICALGVLFLAFEWKTMISDVSDFNVVAEEQIEEEIIPITQQMSSPPPPPPAIPRIADLIEIVESEVMIEDELELTDAEDTSDNTEISSATDFGPYEGESTGEEDIFSVVENMPRFPHGDPQEWIAKNIKYPMIARENGIQGKVILQFVIEKDGSITDVKIVRGVDQSLDKESVRVINMMPKWIPGKQRNKPVRVSFTMPISFRLSNQ